MKKTALFWLLLSLSLAFSGLLSGCDDNETEKTLGETEYYFNDRLSSLSTDGDSAYWIGSETGDITCFSGNVRTVWHLNIERIYDIAAEKADTKERDCWIGVRNSGLQKWRLQTGKASLKATYPIPKKGTRYSAYDVLLTDSSLYVATSQGLYTLTSRRSDDTLRRVYPDQGSPTALHGAPFVVNNVFRFGGAVWASTQEGLLRVDPKTGETRLLHKGENVRHAEAYDGEICVLTSGCFYIDAPDGKNLRKTELPFSARHYYRAGTTHYFLNIGHVFLSQDLETFVPVTLRRSLPEGCHNLMTFSPKEGFAYLLTKNALWRIPAHLGLFHGDASVTDACWSGNDIYYLTARKELFRQKAGETTATKIYAFPQGEHIATLCVSGRDLFYTDGNNHAKHLVLRKKFLENELFSSPETLCELPAKITAATLWRDAQGDRLMLGVQDDVFSVDKTGELHRIPSLSDKYVTSFRPSPGEGRLYLSTLNDGVFYSRGEKFERVPQTEDISFLHDVFATESYTSRLVMLTGHQLILQDSPDTLHVKGCSRLLYAGDTLFYAIPEFGLRKFVIKDDRIREAGTYYSDIAFNPEACFVREGRVFLGSSLGVLSFPAGVEDNGAWIGFNSRVVGLRIFGALGGAMLFLILTGFFVWLRRKRADKRHVSLRIDDLKRRYAALISICDRVDEEQKKAIFQIGKRIEEAEKESSDRKETDLLLTNVSGEIMRRNRDVALQLLRYLDVQTEKIGRTSAAERDELLATSREARESDEIERIKQQVDRNEAWLDSLETIKNGLEKFSLAGCAVISGVNDTIAPAVAHLSGQLDRKTVAELRRDYATLENDFAYIFSQDAREKIRSHALDGRKRLDELTNYEDAVVRLQEKIDELPFDDNETGNLDLLRALFHIDLAVKQLETLEALRTTMKDYADLRQQLVRENEKRINRKSEKELELAIADSTKPQTERIDALIHRFYAGLDRADRDLLTETLGFSNYTGQAPKILCLLLAEPHVKRGFLAGMLGIYGNMNPVVSRLVSGRIRKNEESLRAYADKHPCSPVFLVLKLIE